MNNEEKANEFDKLLQLEEDLTKEYSYSESIAMILLERIRQIKEANQYELYKVREACN
jgi:hypothetical protein